MTAGEAVDVGCDAVYRYRKDVSAVSTTYQQDAVELFVCLFVYVSAIATST